MVYIADKHPYDPEYNLPMPSRKYNALYAQTKILYCLHAILFQYSCATIIARNRLSLIASQRYIIRKQPELKIISINHWNNISLHIADKRLDRARLILDPLCEQTRAFAKIT